MLYDEVDYRGPSAIVIGGEGEGIRRLVLEGCDQVVRIPMEGHVSSLNAAAAGTVILYEALRQRRRDAAPPETRTPRPAAPLQIPEDAVDDGEFAEGDEDVVLEAQAPSDTTSMAGGGATQDGDTSSESETTAATPAENTTPKKRTTRPRAKKKDDD
jgi:hypothetical protein